MMLVQKKLAIILGDSMMICADLFDLPNEISEEAYRERVEKACEFLEGHTVNTIDAQKERMQAYAKKQKYEKASELRDQIIAIQQTSDETRKFERNLIGYITEKESLMTLKEELSLINYLGILNASTFLIFQAVFA